MRCLSAFLACLWAVFPAAWAQANKPAILFENTTRDAGTVIQGDVIKTGFTFMNKGSGLLEITGIRSS
jgi:hypothetical protein